MNIMRSITIATAQPIQNLVAGSSFEYPQQPSQVSLGVICDPAGGLVTVYAGSRLILEESPCYEATTTYPIVPDQMFLNFPILPGERLNVSARNPTGGDVVFGLNAEMTPVR